jgi:hypothetical protein
MLYYCVVTKDVWERSLIVKVMVRADSLHTGSQTNSLLRLRLTPYLSLIDGARTVPSSPPKATVGDNRDETDITTYLIQTVFLLASSKFAPVYQLNACHIINRGTSMFISVTEIGHKSELAAFGNRCWFL